MQQQRWIVFKAKDGETLDEVREWCEKSGVKSSETYGVAVRTKEELKSSDRERIVIETTCTSSKLEKQKAATKRQIMEMYEEKEELLFELNAIKRKIKDLDMEDLFFSSTDAESSAAIAKENRTRSITKVRCEGDGMFPQNKIKTIENAHDNTNVLVVRSDQTNLIASGGVDFCVRVFSSTTNTQLSSIKLNAPILSIDWCPIKTNRKRYLAVSCMDGSLHLLTYEVETNKIILTCSSSKHHDKYVVAIKWNSEGNFLATASHDHTAILFSFNSKCEDEKKCWNDVFTRVQRFCLESAVEDVAFVMRRNSKKESLIIAERSSVYLHIVDVTSFHIEDMNVNERDDTHLSFSILSVVPSPDGSMLCLATDSDQLVVLDSHSGNQICKFERERRRILVFRAQNLLLLRTSSNTGTLVGHKCGQYAQASVCWDPSGDYIYSNSQKDSGIYVWSLATQRVVKRLSEHTKQVRSIDMNMVERSLVSGSFDKSIHLWK